jgi:hypothetical protein
MCCWQYFINNDVDSNLHQIGDVDVGAEATTAAKDVAEAAGVAHGGSLSYYLAAPAAALLVQLPSSKQLPEVRKE